MKKDDTFRDCVESMALALPIDDRSKIAEKLRRSVSEEMLTMIDDTKRPVCPWCGCPDVTRRGHDARDRQRWLCAGCARSFTQGAGTVLSRSKLDADTWIAYAACFADAIPLRDAAERCDVSLKTSWFMRHRLMEAISCDLAPFETGLGMIVEADETMLPASLSGNHSNNGEFRMGRRARRRGGERKAGHGAQLQILTCVNQRGDDFLEVARTRHATRGDVLASLGQLALEGCVVCTDWSTLYDLPLKAMGVACHVRECQAGGGSHTPINLVNAMHSRLKEFVSRFRGISARRMQHYLMWFKWRDESGRLGGRANRISMLVRKIKAGFYFTTWQGCWQTQYPEGVL